MIPNIAVGEGITGSVRYVMGQGNDPVTGARLQLAEGEKRQKSTGLLPQRTHCYGCRQVDMATR